MFQSNLIVTFVRIADAGSLTAAGRELGVSRSVVSERLSALEADLGATLVTRSTHGLSLTPSGEIFLARARQIVADMEKARDEVAEAEGALTGRLRIAVPGALGLHWLAPVFVEFLRQNPGLNLEVSSSDRKVDIVRDGFDVAIRGGRFADSEMIARRLATGRRILVASPAYAESNGLPTSLGDLKDHVDMVYGNRRVSQDWTFRTGDGVTSARVSGRLQIDDGATMCEAAAAGQGVVLLPTFIVSKALLEGRLIPVDIGVSPESDAIAAVYPQSHRSMPRIRSLVDFLRSAISDPPPWDMALADAGLLAIE